MKITEYLTDFQALCLALHLAALPRPLAEREELISKLPISLALGGSDAPTVPPSYPGSASV